MSCMFTRFSAWVKAIRGATRVFAVGAHVSKVLCRSLRTVDLQARRSPMLTFFGIRKILVQAFAAFVLAQVLMKLRSNDSVHFSLVFLAEQR